MTEKPDRNLAMELVRTTEAAAMAPPPVAGRGPGGWGDKAPLGGQQ
jgi:fructose-1,6-bisphosphatase/sedoheptulose 1,7-bisphosphatase-like protein